MSDIPPLFSVIWNDLLPVPLLFSLCTYTLLIFTKGLKYRKKREKKNLRIYHQENPTGTFGHIVSLYIASFFFTAVSLTRFQGMHTSKRRYPSTITASFPIRRGSFAFLIKVKEWDTNFSFIGHTHAYKTTSYTPFLHLIPTKR